MNSCTNKSLEIAIKYCDGEEKGELLIEAVRHKNMGYIGYLVKNGADINYKDNFGGKTALYYAVDSSNGSMCQILFELGADPNIKTDNNESVIELAISYSILKLIPILIKNGAEITDDIFVYNTDKFIEDFKELEKVYRKLNEKR